MSVAELERPSSPAAMPDVHPPVADVITQTVADATPSHARTRNRDAYFRRLLVGADVLAAGLALIVVATLLGVRDELRVEAVLALPIYVVFAKLLGLYDRDELVLHKSTLDEAPAVFQLATFFLLFIWLGERFVQYGAFSKAQFVAVFAIAFVGTLAFRALARTIAERTAPLERCLVLGPAEAAARIDDKLELRAHSGAAIVAREDLEDRDGHVVVSGRLNELVQRTRAERIILVPTATESDAVLDLIREAKSLDVKTSLLPRFTEILGSSVVTDDLYGISLLGMRRLGLSRSSMFMKRAFDLTLSGVALIAVAPLMALIALAVKLDSRGPVFYRQHRIGREGKPFTMLKFRTMVNGADELKAELEHLNESNGLFKIAEDPRITRVGRVLRRTALDELPQLLNVVRGDMSLVGPRPLVVEDDERIVGHDRERLSLLPGMTGHWQVMGAARIPLEEMVAIDYMYVANWSLWSDMKTLLRTVPYMLRARGL